MFNMEMPRSKNFGNISRKKLYGIRHLVEKARRIRFTENISEVRSARHDHMSASTCDNNTLEMPCNTISKETRQSPILGRRMVEISYFIRQLQEIASHTSLFSCNLGTVELLNEKRTGLKSIFYMKCQMCGLKFVLKSSEDSNNKMDVNEEVVAGIMTIGAGITQLNTILCHVNMPVMSLRVYQSKHDTISRWWRKTAEHCMAEAGKEEKKYAISIGNLNDNGIPMISVSGDACWSKRSYGTNYSASSGVGAIIGNHTRKVLFYNVKNKQCSICSRAISKSVEPTKHTCFKNFHGPSTAMEADIITEGFKKSISIHGIIYSQYVADGDASTYASIRNSRPYDNVTVGKIECKNHLLRNYCKGLLAISHNTIYSLRARKILKENYLRIRWGIDSSIKYWNGKNISFEDKVKNIKNDIMNGPYHIFGDHTKCAFYFCTDAIKRVYRNIVPELMSFGIFQKIEDLANRLSLHAYSFAYNKTNNCVESFNERVAKFVGGKRVNFSQRGSYLARCAAAVVSYNTGFLQSTVHKFIFDSDANTEILKLEQMRHILNQKRLERQVNKKKNVRSATRKDDAYYDESCQKMDMEEEQFIETKIIFLKSLQLTDLERENIEKDTILQSESPLWLETRRKLVTASWFAIICKRRLTMECGPLVRQILYGKDICNVASIKHGRCYEQTAIRELEIALKIKIRPCGLFIDQEFIFLGASPDGKCNLGIVEVKCPSSAFNMDPDDAIKQKKNNFWLLKDKSLIINKKHKWYYQIQGQLRITGQDTCVFAVWTAPGQLKHELIKKDPLFWKEKMETQLIKFYNNCLLPELIDSRHTRNMELRKHSSHS